MSETASGIAVIIVSIIVRLPQIFYVIKHRSIDGISFDTFAMKDLIYGMTSMYYYKNHYPLMLYGENVILFASTTFLLSAMLSVSLYKQDPRHREYVAKFLLSISLTLVILAITNMQVIFYAQNLIIAIDFVCNIPQIYKLFKEKNAGNLDITMFVFSSIGNTLRTYSLLVNKESKSDVTAVMGSVIGIVTNTLTVGQIIWYRYLPGWVKNINYDNITLFDNPIKYNSIDFEMMPLDNDAFSDGVEEDPLYSSRIKSPSNPNTGRTMCNPRLVITPPDKELPKIPHPDKNSDTDADEDREYDDDNINKAFILNYHFFIY